MELPSEKNLPDNSKYKKAVALYGGTRLSIREIAQLTGVTSAALSAHIRRHHRDLLIRRYGIESTNTDLSKIKVKAPKGQSQQTFLKYRDAVEACAGMEHIALNVSQIARLFNLNPTALANQLRFHYPEIIPEREKLRHQLAVADNHQRGPRSWTEEGYAEAIDLYHTSTMTIPEVAEQCEVSGSGLSQFMRFYRKKVIADRAEQRETDRVAMARQREEVRQEDMARRKAERLSTGTAKSREAADKYAEAISNLRENPRPIAQVAAQFGLNADVFRQYLKAHSPELVSAQGLRTQVDGKRVKRTSEEKYTKGIQEYTTSPLPMKEIAERHGLVYKSLMSYLKRNHPDAIEKHKKATEAAKA